MNQIKTDRHKMVKITFPDGMYVSMKMELPATILPAV